MIEKLVREILLGKNITQKEALEAAITPVADDLYDAAHKITVMMAPRDFDLCSIVNAKSGACTEDCKWCSQSAHYSTESDVYEFIGAEKCLELARYNEEHGVGRFSIVTSGRSPDSATFEEILETVRLIKANSGIFICASLGLLGEDELRRLRAAGVERYHCNLEAAPSRFSELCTTHSTSEKIASLKAAREAGMEICSGGIIGMGETMEKRVELAFALKELEIKSIPINILCPIPGTPLADEPRLSDEEILRTVAVFRLIHPDAHLRFAGGRIQMTEDGVRKALYIGINASITGDMLTTAGADIESDIKLARDAGYSVPRCSK